MKIEDFKIDMHSSYHQQKSIIASFDKQLQSEESARIIEAKEAVKYEKNLTSQIHFMLLEQLIQQLFATASKADTPINTTQPPTQKKKLVNVQTTEFQQFNLNMGGFIQTDTQKISIDINVSISHTLISKHSFEASHCIDPLVINLNGEIPSLDSSSFHFDIDNDGESDQISNLSSGNGFLALDANNSGTIDRGSELFGTKLGNGFAELSLFDKDNNMWIDENDAIFDKLRIWVKNRDKDELLTLGEVGIGAIYLGSNRSEFHYKDEEKNLGELRSSGFYLHENGKSGIVSQIDLAKHKDTQITTDEPLANLILQS